MSTSVVLLIDISVINWYANIVIIDNSVIDIFDIHWYANIVSIDSSFINIFTIYWCANVINIDVLSLTFLSSVILSLKIIRKIVLM